MSETTKFTFLPYDHKAKTILGAVGVSPQDIPKYLDISPLLKKESPGEAITGKKWWKDKMSPEFLRALTVLGFAPFHVKDSDTFNAIVLYFFQAVFHSLVDKESQVMEMLERKLYEKYESEKYSMLALYMLSAYAYLINPNSERIPVTGISDKLKIIADMIKAITIRKIEDVHTKMAELALKEDLTFDDVKVYIARIVQALRDFFQARQDFYFMYFLAKVIQELLLTQKLHVEKDFSDPHQFLTTIMGVSTVLMIKLAELPEVRNGKKENN